MLSNPQRFALSPTGERVEDSLCELAILAPSTMTTEELAFFDVRTSFHQHHPQHHQQKFFTTSIARHGYSQWLQGRPRRACLGSRRRDSGYVVRHTTSLLLRVRTLSRTCLSSFQRVRSRARTVSPKDWRTQKATFFLLCKMLELTVIQCLEVHSPSRKATTRVSNAHV